MVVEQEAAKARLAETSPFSRDPKSFRTLPSFRLYKLEQQSAKLHERRYKKLFGLKLSECRTLDAVGVMGEATLWHLQVDLTLGKSPVMVLVSRLHKMGLLAKTVGDRDRRITKVTLTARGRATHKALHEAAISLNEEWLSTLSKQQREMFLSSLDALMASAGALFRLREG